MRDRWRICRQRAAGLVCGLGLVLVLQLAPQVSLAATELACECETIEVVASGSSRRSIPLRNVSHDRVDGAASQVDRAGLAFTSATAPLPPTGHCLSNGNRAPLRC